MFRRLATLVATLYLIRGVLSDEVDPCRRQAFRGRCPSINGAAPMRSQFVLRYYLRGDECVSYPYGHCANDDNEPNLFRYKEECEDACSKQPGPEKSKILGSKTVSADGVVEIVEPGTQAPQSTGELTYATGAASEVTTGSYETPKTECQRQRDSRGQGLIKGGFVPDCAPNGEFKQLQCEQDKSECFCVNIDGIEIDNSRTKAHQEKPDCERIIAASPQRTNECVGGLDIGPCRSAIPRWFYDEASQSCQQFTYSGCGGNGNNYPTQAACEHRCVPAKEAGKCHKGKEPLRTSQGQIVNCAKTECPAGYKCSVIQHSSVCCPDDEKSVVGVLHSGVGAAACDLPKERGPCDRYELRFYFNKELNECKYFFYGGCEGNDNNFARVEDCEKTCGAKSSSDAPPPQQAVVNEKVTIATTTTQKPTTAAPTTTTETTTTQRLTTTTTAARTTQRPTTTPEIRTPEVDVRTFPPATTPELPTDRCLHPRDEGSCGGQFVRWLWNNEKRKCESFPYTGCGGNGNNFASMEECLSICHIEVVKPEPVPEIVNVCESPVDAGECSGTFMRYGFEPSTNECHQFAYTGCGGNGNNFATLSDCHKKCVPQKGPEPTPFEPPTASTSLNATLQVTPNKNICDHPIEIGECSGIFHRFAYDADSNECRQFDYGGCGGNGNNFATINECRLACVRVRCPPAPTCDTSRCQVVNDVHGCPFCSCPPPPQHPPIIPTFQPHCPPLDVNLCTEPCIIFSNHKGCKECVCPVLPSQMPPQSLPPSRPVQPPPPPTPEISMPQPIPKPQPPAPAVRVQPPAPQTPPPQPFVPRVVAPPAPIRQPAPPAPPSPPAPRFNTNDIVQPVLGGVSNTSPERPLPVPTQRPRATIADLGEKCTQPVDPGPCKNFVERWHFNQQQGLCEPFSYGGCAGNRNHFFSLKECEVHCARFSRIPRPFVEVNEVIVESPRPVVTQPPTIIQPIVPTRPPTPPPAPVFAPIAQNPVPSTVSIEPSPPTLTASDTLSQATHQSVQQESQHSTFVSSSNTITSFQEEHRKEVTHQSFELPPVQKRPVWGSPPRVSTTTEAIPTTRRPASPPSFAPPVPQKPAIWGPPPTVVPRLPEVTTTSFAPPPSSDPPKRPIWGRPRTSTAPTSTTEEPTTPEVKRPVWGRPPSVAPPEATTTAEEPTTTVPKRPVWGRPKTVQHIVPETTTTEEPTTPVPKRPVWGRPRTTTLVPEEASTDAPRSITNPSFVTPHSAPSPSTDKSSVSQNIVTITAPPRTPPPRPAEKSQPLRPLPTQPPHFQVPTLPPKLPVPDVNRQFAQPTFNQAAIEKPSENPYRPPQPPLRPEFNPRVSPYIPPQPPTREEFGRPVPHQPEVPKAVNPQDQWPANTKKPTGGSYGMEHIKLSGGESEGRHHLLIQPIKPTAAPPTAAPVTEKVVETTQAPVTAPKVAVTEAPKPVPVQTEPPKPAPKEEEEINHVAGIKPIFRPISEVAEEKPAQHTAAPTEAVTHPTLASKAPEPVRPEATVPSVAVTQPTPTSKAPQPAAPSPTPEAPGSYEQPQPSQTLEVLKTPPKEPAPAEKPANSQTGSGAYEIGDITAPSTEAPKTPEDITASGTKPAAPVNEYRVFGEKSNAQKAIEPPTVPHNLGKEHVPLPATIRKVNTLGVVDGGSDRSVGRNPVGLPEGFVTNVITDTDMGSKIILSTLGEIEGEVSSGHRVEEGSSSGSSSVKPEAVPETIKVPEVPRIPNLQKPTVVEVDNKPLNRPATIQPVIVKESIDVVAETVTQATWTPKAPESARTEVPPQTRQPTRLIPTVRNTEAPKIEDNLSVIAGLAEASQHMETSSTTGVTQTAPTVRVTEEPATKKLIKIHPITRQPLPAETTAPEIVTEAPSVTEEERIMSPNVIGEIEEHRPQEVFEPEEVRVPPATKLPTPVIEKVIESVASALPPRQPVVETRPTPTATTSYPSSSRSTTVSPSSPTSPSTPQPAEKNIIHEGFTVGSNVWPTPAPTTTTTQEALQPQPAPVFTPRPIRPAPTPPPTAAPNTDITIFGPPERPEVDTEACVQPPDAGKCRNFVPRWFYNSEKGACQEFTYGSCGGNANNFVDKASCEAKCALPSLNVILPQRCNWPKDEGFGNGYHVKWYFNARNLRCEQMVFRGNGGNDNQFSSQGDCELSCKPVPGHTVPHAPHPPPRKFPKETDKKPLPVSNVRGAVIADGYGPAPAVEIPETIPAAAPNAPTANAPAGMQPTAPAAGPAPGSAPQAPSTNQYVPPSPPLRPEYTETAPVRQPAAPSPTPTPVESAPQPVEVNHSAATNAGYSGQESASAPSSGAASTSAAAPASVAATSAPAEANEGVNHEVSLSSTEAKENKEAESNAISNSGFNHASSLGAGPSKPSYESENAVAPSANVDNQGASEANPEPQPEQPVETAPAAPQTPAAPETPEAPVSNNIAPDSSKYGAEPAADKMKPTADSNLPLIGKSPKATIDYTSGKRLDTDKAKAHGIATSTNENGDFLFPDGLDSKNIDVLKPINGEEEEALRIPMCPNNLQPMVYDDGKPVVCLPGLNQCPENSVCYFNGMDYSCCPNSEDPYDQHIFGGYDGEEVKHGYKSVPTSLNIRSITKRQAGIPPSAFSIDHITKPLRFDDKPVRQISRAGSVDALARLRVNPCTQEVQEGDCNEAHLRYFYDINSDTCRLFYYTGCGGNTNNFMTQNECNQRCKLGVVITTTEAPVPPGRCPGGKLPLGENAPVLCGNQTDSIGCPNGYYCRSGPPDVCCPDETPDLQAILAQNGNREIRRKPFISAAGKFEGGEHHHHHEHHHEHAAAHGVATAEGGYDASNAEVHTGGASQTNEHPTSAAPAQESAASASSGTQESSAATSGQSSSSSSSSSNLFILPDNICPDGSDALTGDDGKTKQCGSGFDGHELCPKGFYCSMDPERNSRLCCPMTLQGSNIPPPPATAPYFGHRRANPGEVVERGSLPSDPKPPKLSTPKPKTHMTMEDLETAGMESKAEFHAPGVQGSEGGKAEYDELDMANAPGTRPEEEAAAPSEAVGGHPDVVQTEEKPTPLNPSGPAQVQPADMPTHEGQEEKGPYAHMRLKPFDRVNKVHHSRANETNAVSDDGVHIRVNSQEDPFEVDGDSKRIYKEVFDLSTCQLRPSEGRQCREDEPQPLTNLQYFFSVKDRKCKLFFHRGCGGNQNRFDTKAECEKACSSLMGQ